MLYAKSQKVCSLGCLFLLGLLLSYCKPAATVAPPIDQQALNNQQNNQISQEQLNAQNRIEDLQPLDPQKAQVSLLSGGKVRLAEAAEGTDLEVPELRLADFRDLDFVRVVRCAADYELKTSLGEPFEELDGKRGSDRDKMKWIWQRAAQREQSCRYVGTSIYRDRIQDLAAKPGRFFYLINPCVSKDRSTTGREDCSYRLQKTDDFEFEGQELDKDFYAYAGQLTNKETELSGLFNSLYLVAKQIKREQDECERAWRNRQARSAFFSGVTQLLGFAVGTVAGSFIAGPIGGSQGGRVALGLAKSLFGARDEPIECPQVESLVERVEGVPDQIEQVTEDIRDIREKMAEVEDSYRSLNAEILEQNEDD